MHGEEESYAEGEGWTTQQDEHIHHVDLGGDPHRLTLVEEPLNVNPTVEATQEEHWSEQDVSISEKLSGDTFYEVVWEESKGESEEETESGGVDRVTSENNTHHDLRLVTLMEHIRVRSAFDLLPL